MDYPQLILFAIFVLIVARFLYGRLKYGSWTGSFLKGSIDRTIGEVQLDEGPGARIGEPPHSGCEMSIVRKRAALVAALFAAILRNSERIARRTIVLSKIRGTRLIAHLHASNVPASVPER
jgi:hypothetical protein